MKIRGRYVRYAELEEMVRDLREKLKQEQDDHDARVRILVEKEGKLRWIIERLKERIAGRDADGRKIIPTNGELF